MKNLLPFMLCGFYFSADTGGAEGGGSSEVADLSEWVKRLEGASAKARPGIARELARILNIPIPEAWAKLREAGWSSKGAKSTEDNLSETDNRDIPETGEHLTAKLRHKTGHPFYRRAGLVLTDQFKAFEVTAEQFAVLERDPWVEIQKA